MSEPPEIDTYPDSDGNQAVDKDAANELFTPAMRLFELQGKHRVLDRKIVEMYEYPYQNQILLQRLKKEKLRLKDCIERLKNELVPDLNA
ncbi:MAG: hypothetical protein ACI9B9_002349 [Halioglobus sp.]|jgi:hypothetical protein